MELSGTDCNEYGLGWLDVEGFWLDIQDERLISNAKSEGRLPNMLGYIPTAASESTPSMGRVLLDELQDSIRMVKGEYR